MSEEVDNEPILENKLIFPSEYEKFKCPVCNIFEPPCSVRKILESNYGLNVYTCTKGHVFSNGLI